jgi:hypothetical protein
MNSPYTPPKSEFPDGPVEVGALRWRGAVIFASVPALIMVVVQATYLYRVQEFQTAQDWAQIFYFLPVVLVAAVVGYAAALKCARASLLGILPLAAASGCLIALGGSLTASVVMPLLGSPPLPYLVQLGFFLGRVVVFVSLSAIQCAVIRFYARRMGLAAAK